MTATMATRNTVTPTTKGKGTWVKLGVGGGVLLLAAWGAFALIGSRPPAPDGTIEDVAKFVASEKFANLPADRQKAYMDHLSWENLRDLAPEDRRAVAEVMREYRERETVRNYMAMSPAERRKHLDEVIKQEQERRAQWEARAAQWQGQRPERAEGQQGRPGGEGQGQGRSQGGWGGRNSPEREKARLENRDPAMRAASAQYRADLAQRRAELGVTSGGPGGGGGGWGRGPR